MPEIPNLYEDKVPITKEDIEKQMTENGGYTRKTLAQWGIGWPPPQGWKNRLIKRGFYYVKK